VHQYGERENYKIMKTGKDKVGETIKNATRDNKEWAKAAQQVRKETVANRAEVDRMCAKCNKTAELAGVKALLACQKCKAIGRYVYYCGRCVSDIMPSNAERSHKSNIFTPGFLVGIVKFKTGNMATPLTRQSAEIRLPLQTLTWVITKGRMKLPLIPITDLAAKTRKKPASNRPSPDTLAPQLSSI
jgi:hypothetical protein